MVHILSSSLLHSASPFSVYPGPLRAATLSPFACTVPPGCPQQGLLQQEASASPCLLLGRAQTRQKCYHCERRRTSPEPAKTITVYTQPFFPCQSSTIWLSNGPCRVNDHSFSLLIDLWAPHIAIILLQTDMEILRNIILTAAAWETLLGKPLLSMSPH